MKTPRHKTLITEKRIRRRVADLAEQINSDYKGRELALIFISRGAFVFTADLARKIRLPVRIDCVSANSYRGLKSSGKVEIDANLKIDIKRKHVLLVDDILDSGITLNKVIRRLEKLGPADIRTCVLLDKTSKRKVPLKADYVGFEIPDVFVYGYGLDYDEYCRNLPYVACLKK
ncbi:MAG TPA: hypoxanthine phosphoribosyltransferase [Lentisphaeria bacterium]|nr:MAG: hypoxanthine phosphoribosyltransferase [Lentisphaerae bacterium GWF2_49_21]HBC88893.1 hypoxanthine phosphoribosyltransferase [Lentisphaeria bacterium]